MTMEPPIWWFPEMGGTSSRHPFLDGIFHEIKTIQRAWGTHTFMETPIWDKTRQGIRPQGWVYIPLHRPSIW